MTRWIDLNADVGERPEALRDGSEARLLQLVTSVNIACGGHAGNRDTMSTIVALARHLGLAIGAHPSYPDPLHFGRRDMAMSSADLERSIAAQVRALATIVRQHGATLRHVKPHGALYNAAARDAGVAASIAGGLTEWRDDCILVGLAGAITLDIWRQQGFRVAAEAFADRRYEANGSLRARTHADAQITDPQTAAQQAVEIVVHGRLIVAGVALPLCAQTLCIHGDTPNAVAIAQRVRQELEAHGIGARALGAG